MKTKITIKNQDCIRFEKTETPAFRVTLNILNNDIALLVIPNNSTNNVNSIYVDSKYYTIITSSLTERNNTTIHSRCKVIQLENQQ